MNLPPNVSTLIAKCQGITKQMQEASITCESADKKFLKLDRKHRDNPICSAVVAIYRGKFLQYGPIEQATNHELEAGLLVLDEACQTLCREQKAEYVQVLAEGQLEQARYLIEIGRRKDLSGSHDQAYESYKLARQLAYNAKQAMFDYADFRVRAFGLIDLCDEALTPLRKLCGIGLTYSQSF